MSRRQALVYLCAAVILVSGAASACSLFGGGDDKDQQPSGTEEENDPGGGAGGPRRTGPEAFILNEIRVSGDGQFVELKNTGAGAASPSGLELVVKDAAITLPSYAPSAAPGTVILFDFVAGAVEGNVVHLGNPLALVAEGGCLELKKGDQRLDTVCWGADAADPAVLSRGGRAASEAAGSSLGRAPNSISPDAQQDWRSFLPGEASPGKSNQFQGIVHGLPMAGATVAPGQVELMWYAMAGATGYRLRIGSEPTLATLSTDVTVPGGVGAGDLVRHSLTLATGVLQWSVTALYEQGEGAPSLAQALIVRPPAAAAAESGVSAASVAQAVAATGKVLPVPLIYNHRDTSMLALEAPDETGAKPWDRPWEPRQGPFCARASIAMITRYYNGDLSQDRISYEAFKDFVAFSPKFDLYIGGFSGGNIAKGLRLAVGGSRLFDMGSLDNFMATVKTEIDQNRPILGSSFIHAWVIIGYGEDDRGEYIVMNDPAAGRVEMVMKPSAAYTGVSGEFQQDERGLDTHFLMPLVPQSGAIDEPEIHRDSDGDGIVDFDESERFGTNPSNKDSDSDEVPDKEDVRAWVWDQEFGWARSTRLSNARSYQDTDSDGIPMQADPDSDGGGCLDGLEDLDKDGRREEDADETSVFKKEDDRCISGTFLTLLEQHSSTEFQDTDVEYELKVTFSLKPKEDGTLEGVGAVEFFTLTHDVNKTAPCESFIGPIQMSWRVTLTGRVVDGVVSFEADPPTHPFTANVTGSCGTDSFLYEATAFYGWADIKFIDGVYEYRVDTPHTAPDTGHSLVEVKMKQKPPD